jgi:hypothetical protein
MRHHHHRAVQAPGAQRLQDSALGDGVEMNSRLIQDEKRCIFEESARRSIPFRLVALLDV